MTTSELLERLLDELLHGAEQIVEKAVKRWVKELPLMPLPLTLLFTTIDVVQEAAGSFLNLPSAVLTRVAAQWALASQPGVKESRVITELECSLLVTDFAIDAMYAANGLTQRAQRTVRVALISDGLGRLRKWREKILDRMNRIEGGTVYRIFSTLGKPLRVIAWILQIVQSILRWAITVFLVILLMAWIDFTAKGGLRRHTLKQDSKRVKIDLPPTRLRRRLP